MGLGGLSGAMLAQQSAKTVTALEQAEQDKCIVEDFLVSMYDELKTHPDQVEYDSENKYLLSKKTVELINTLTVKY